MYNPTVLCRKHSINIAYKYYKNVPLLEIGNKNTHWDK